MNQTHPNHTSHLFLLIRTFVLFLISIWQHSQYNYQDICWNNLGSNLGRSKRTISSPKHRDQLQHPHSLQLNENQSFFSGSKVARADNLTTHICLGPSLKISGATPPQNLPASMAQSGTTLFYLNLLPMYIFLNRSHHFWSYTGTFYTLHTTYMHTTRPIYFISTEPIPLTLRSVPVPNLII